MTLSINAQRELCVVQKAGGIPLALDEILRLVGMLTNVFVCFLPQSFVTTFAEIGVHKVKELDALVEDALREDWNGRRIEVR